MVIRVTGQCQGYKVAELMFESAQPKEYAYQIWVLYQKNKKLMYTDTRKIICPDHMM